MNLILTFLADITSFGLATGVENMFYLETGGTVNVNLVYGGGTATGVSGRFDYDTGSTDIITGSTPAATTAALTISASDISATFGTYLLTISLVGDNTKTKDVVVFFEESITGFEVRFLFAGL